MSSLCWIKLLSGSLNAFIRTSPERPYFLLLQFRFNIFLPRRSHHTRRKFLFFFIYKIWARREKSFTWLASPRSLTRAIAWCGAGELNVIPKTNCGLHIPAKKLNLYLDLMAKKSVIVFMTFMTLIILTFLASTLPFFFSQLWSFILIFYPLPYLQPDRIMRVKDKMKIHRKKNQFRHDKVHFYTQATCRNEEGRDVVRRDTEKGHPHLKSSR